MKKIVSSALLLSLVLGAGLVGLEAGLVNAANSSTTAVNATVSPEISITTAPTVNLAPAILSITGGTATGAASWTVVSGDANGYDLTLQKNQTLQTSGGGANKEFVDLSTTTPVFNFESVANGEEKFGFAVTSGSDTVATFKDNGAICGGAGANVAGNCWSAVPSAQAVTIAHGSGATSGAGNTTTVQFQAKAGGSNALQSGSYSTTITATAVAL